MKKMSAKQNDRWPIRVIAKLGKALLLCLGLLAMLALLLVAAILAPVMIATTLVPVNGTGQGRRPKRRRHGGNIPETPAPRKVAVP
jgi:hypothetical protein